MIQQAIACDDPVIFFEPKRRYWEKGEVDPAAEPPPLFTSRVLRPGSDADRSSGTGRWCARASTPRSPPRPTGTTSR